MDTRATADPPTDALEPRITELSRRLDDATSRAADAERRLALAEQRLEQVLAAGKIGVFEHDHATGLIHATPGLARMCGVEPGQALSLDGVLARLHPHDRDRVEPAIHACHDPRGDGVLDTETRLDVGQGYRWFRTRAATEFEGEGDERRPFRTVGVVEDVTAARQANEALERERDRLRQILDAANGLTAVLALDGTIVEVNRPPVELIGLAREDAIGRKIWDVPWVRPSWEQSSRRVIERVTRGEIVETDARSRFPDGAERELQITVSPLRDSLGRVVNVVVFGVDVTERKCVERQVRTSEERLRQAVRVADIGIFDHDHETDMIFWSPELRRMYGWDAHTPHPLHDFLDLVHPEDRPLIGAAVERAHGPGGDGSFDVQYRIHRTDDGTLRWLEARSQTFFDGNGAARRRVRTTGAVADVTAERLASDAVFRERNQLRQILDSQHGYTAVLERDGTIVEVNRAPLALMGIERQEARGRKFWEVGWTPPEWIDGARDAIARAAAGETVELDTQASFALAGTRDVRVTIYPIKDTAGAVTTVVVFGIDVTERKRVEEQVRTSEERLRQAVHVSHIGIFDHDHRSGALYWSPELRALHGWPADDPVRLGDFVASVHPDDRDALVAAIERSRDPASDGLFELEHRQLRVSDGAVRWLKGSAQTYFEGEGSERQPARTVGAVLDTTDAKRGEERLRESLREKETLLREVHHRVKNNIQLISSLLYFHTKKAPNPEIAAVFEDVRERLRSMSLVHEQLYRAPNLAEIDFEQYVRALVAELARPRVGATRAVRFEVATTAVRLPVETALPLGMILAELLTNVFKYAYPESSDGSARVELSTEGGSLRVTVTDQGVGLPCGFAPDDTGTFGWRLVTNLVRQLGGSVELGSKHGTRVVVSVPLGS